MRAISLKGSLLAASIFFFLFYGCSTQPGSSVADSISGASSDVMKYSLGNIDDADGDMLEDVIDGDPFNGNVNASRESEWFFLESFDGTKIECKLLLPAGTGPFPVVMVGHGWFSKGQDMYGQARMFQQNGYASLIWSARGWGKSGDIIRLDSSMYEVKDVIRIINWISEQPFVIRENAPEKNFENGGLVEFDFNMDGNEEADDIPGDETNDFILGMSGGSYGGAIQVMTASFDRRIDAIASEESWVDLHDALVPGDSMKIFWSLGFYAGGLVRQQEGSGIDPALTEWLIYTFLTSDISSGMRSGLKLRSPVVRLEKVNVPVLTINGKYDTVFDLNQSVRLFESARSRGYDAKMYWFSGGHSYSARFGSHIRSMVLRWMDKHLKNKIADTGAEFEYDIQNPDGSFSTISSSWPRVKSADETRMMLHSNLKGGWMTASSEAGSSKYAFELIADAVANIPFIQTSLTEIQGQGMLPEEYHFIPFDSPLTSAEYVTGVFADDTEITGVPRLDIWLSAWSWDMTFFVKLYDVDENGSVSDLDVTRLKNVKIKDMIADLKAALEDQHPILGDDSLSSHHITPFRIPVSEPFDYDSGDYYPANYSRASDALMDDLIGGKPVAEVLDGITPQASNRRVNLAKPALYSFDLRGISRIIKAGHRLKLIIATSDFCYIHSRVPGIGFIWHNSKYPSCLYLPVVKEG